MNTSTNEDVNDAVKALLELFGYELVRIEPIRHIDELRELIRQGHVHFSRVTYIPGADAKANPNSVWRNDFIITGVKLESGVGSYFATGLHRTYYSNEYCAPHDGTMFSLSDTNVKNERNTGYNDHFLFRSQKEADLYIEHLRAGGPTLARTE